MLPYFLLLTALASNRAVPVTTVQEGTPVPPNLPTPYTAGQAVCEGVPGCTVQEISPAGYDGSRFPLAVVRVGLPPKASMDDEEATTCDRYQWWAVTWQDTRVRPLQLLLEACNDGYGASGVGEDAITVGENRFEWTRYGGSAWRWTQGATARISPPQVHTESQTGFWASDPYHIEARLWDWDTLSGVTRWYAPPCGKGGQPDPTGLPPDDVPAELEYRFVDLPQVTVPSAYLSGTWKRTPVGTCGARVDSGNGEGFVVFGTPGDAADASFKAVLAGPQDLFVEVTDDLLQATARTPLFKDHLEIWTGEKASYAEFCMDPKPRPAQWLIGLDGSVTPSFGEPEVHPTAQVAVDGQTARFHVVLPEEVSALTVVWSDSDDGQAQERLIATSRLKRGDRASLGRPTRFEEETLACEIKGGRLDMVSKRPPQLRVALIGGE